MGPLLRIDEKSLAGNAGSEIVQRAKDAKFDERLSLISLLISSLEDSAASRNLNENCLRTVLKEIRTMDALNEEELQAKKELWHRKSELTDAKEHVDLAFACEDPPLPPALVIATAPQVTFPSVSITPVAVVLSLPMLLVNVTVLALVFFVNT